MIETRGYTCGDARSFKRYGRAIAALRTSNPFTQVSALSDGVNEVKLLTPNPLTKDPQKFYPHGHPDGPDEGDPLSQARRLQRFAADLDNFAGHDYELIPVGPWARYRPLRSPCLVCARKPEPLVCG